MFTHHNTVNYRLNKINSFFNHSPKKGYGLV
ncbi:MAG: helix-turn-helix domain-containing protein [Limosilactobacillus pontis]